MTGLIIFLLFFALPVITEFIKSKAIDTGESTQNVQKHYQYKADKKAVLVGLVILLFHSMIDFIFHIPSLVFLFIILIAFIRRIDIETSVIRDYSFRVSGKVIRFILSICVMLSCFLIYFLIRQYLGYHVFKKAQGKDLVSDISHIERAIELDFGNSQYHNSLGGAYFRLYGITHKDDHLLRGIKEAELAQTLNPEDYRFPLALGEGYLNLYCIFPYKSQFLVQAAHEFKKSLNLAPYLYKVFLNLGKVYLQQKDISSAQKSFKEAITLEPNSLEGYYLMGLAYEAEGDIKAAHSEYQTILTIKDKGFENLVTNSYEQGLIDFDPNIVLNKLNWEHPK